jgi:hypothetical protein
MVYKVTQLKPADYYVWDHLKSIVYATAVDDVMELQQRVEGGCEFITPGIF